jgi:hypothetical protein
MSFSRGDLQREWNYSAPPKLNVVRASRSLAQYETSSSAVRYFLLPVLLQLHGCTLLDSYMYTHPAPSSIRGTRWNKGTRRLGPGVSRSSFSDAKSLHCNVGPVGKSLNNAETSPIGCSRRVEDSRLRPHIRQRGKCLSEKLPLSL